jgi:hypothetical protein
MTIPFFSRAKRSDDGARLTVRVFVPKDAAAIVVGAQEVVKAIESAATAVGQAIEIVRPARAACCGWSRSSRRGREDWLPGAPDRLTFARCGVIDPCRSRTPHASNEEFLCQKLVDC